MRRRNANKEKKKKEINTEEVAEATGLNIPKPSTVTNVGESSRSKNFRSLEKDTRPDKKKNEINTEEVAEAICLNIPKPFTVTNVEESSRSKNVQSLEKDTRPDKKKNEINTDEVAEAIYLHVAKPSTVTNVGESSRSKNVRSLEKDTRPDKKKNEINTDEVAQAIYLHIANPSMATNVGESSRSKNVRSLEKDIRPDSSVRSQQLSDKEIAEQRASRSGRYIIDGINRAIIRVSGSDSSSESPTKRKPSYKASEIGFLTISDLTKMKPKLKSPINVTTKDDEKPVKKYLLADILSWKTIRKYDSNRSDDDQVVCDECFKTNIPKWKPTIQAEHSVTPGTSKSPCDQPPPTAFQQIKSCLFQVYDQSNRRQLCVRGTDKRASYDNKKFYVHIIPGTRFYHMLWCDYIQKPHNKFFDFIPFQDTLVFYSYYKWRSFDSFSVYMISDDFLDRYTKCTGDIFKRGKVAFLYGFEHNLVYDSLSVTDTTHVPGTLDEMPSASINIVMRPTDKHKLPTCYISTIDGVLMMRFNIPTSVIDDDYWILRRRIREAYGDRHMYPFREHLVTFTLFPSFMDHYDKVDLSDLEFKTEAPYANNDNGKFKHAEVTPHIEILIFSDNKYLMEIGYLVLRQIFCTLERQDMTYEDYRDKVYLATAVDCMTRVTQVREGAYTPTMSARKRRLKEKLYFLMMMTQDERAKYKVLKMILDCTVEDDHCDSCDSFTKNGTGLIRQFLYSCEKD